MSKQNYYYECPLPTCKEHADMLIAPKQAPWCNTASHSKEMKFVPEKSTGIPEHMNKKDKGK